VRWTGPRSSPLTGSTPTQQEPRCAPSILMCLIFPTGCLLTLIATSVSSWISVDPSAWGHIHGEPRCSRSGICSSRSRSDREERGKSSPAAERPPYKRDMDAADFPQGEKFWLHPGGLGSASRESQNWSDQTNNQNFAVVMNSAVVMGPFDIYAA
jgi:hypothetical protein